MQAMQAMQDVSIMPTVPSFSLNMQPALLPACTLQIAVGQSRDNPMHEALEAPYLSADDEAHVNDDDVNDSDAFMQGH